MLKFLYQIPFLRRLYFEQLGIWWVRRKVAPFIRYLKTSDKVLDVGSGNGLIAYYLQQQGFEVTPLDVVDMAFDAAVQPIVYDGDTMPFEDQSYDVALILTVLHHTPQPEAILAETARVARKVIIIEDIYKNTLQKHLTFFMDWLINLGYSAAPHTNKDDKGWKDTFKNMQLDLQHTSQWRVLVFFRQVVYILTR